MMECITRNKYKWIAAAIVLGFWWGMSQLYSPLVVPPIGMVAKKIIEILTSRDMWGEIAKTVLRLLAGLGIGVGIGIVAGIFGGMIKPVREIIKPILGIIQVVPPISWLILAIMWFGFNGRASVFIVVMSVVPPIFICIVDGIASIDHKLVEMGRVFQFHMWKSLRYILIPSIMPHFLSGLKIASGMACKVVVMGEVLTTTSGIGGQIMTARLNIEPETVIAWTVIVVMIYYVTTFVGKLLVVLKKRMERWKRCRKKKNCCASGS